MSLYEFIEGIINATAWPVVLIIIALVFRSPIAILLNALGSLLQKVNKAKVGNFEFSGSSKLSEIGDNKLLNKEFEKYYKVAQPASITNEEDIIKNQLKDAQLDGEKAIIVLISQLANKNVLLQLLLINFLIFNEQIEVLVYANENTVISYEKVQTFYQKYERRYNNESNPSSPHTHIKFEPFLGFLIDTRLLSHNANGFSITDFGKEYLSFVVKTGRKLTTTPTP